jgi:hypothetical protein
MHFSSEVQKFFKNLGATPKFWKEEASSILGAHCSGVTSKLYC